MAIETVLFDGDGTLFDSVKFGHENARKTILECFGYTIESHVLFPTAGLALREMYSSLGYCEEDVGRLVNIHNRIQVENCHTVLPFQNTISTLQKLKEMSIKTGLVTMRGGPTLEIILSVSGILPYLDTVVNGLDVPKEKRKPHPEPVLIAIRKLRAESPEKVLMVGDTPLDLLAAKAANVRSGAALWGESGEELLKLYPDYVFEDISEVPKMILGR